MPRRYTKYTDSPYPLSSRAKELIELLSPHKKEYERLIQVELDKPGGGSLKDFPSWEEYLRKKLNKTTAEIQKITGVADYHGMRPEIKLSEARSTLLTKLIDIDNNKPDKPTSNYKLAEQAGYKIKFRDGKPQGHTAPPGSFKNLKNTTEKILTRVDDVIENFENLSVDKIKKEGGIYRYIGKPFGIGSEAVQVHLRKFPEKYKTARVDLELLQNPNVLQKYSNRGLNAGQLLVAYEAGKGGPEFSRVVQKGPVQKIMEYAGRHVSEGGKLITKLDDDSFVYNNKIFSMEPDALSLKQALSKRGLQDAKVIDLVTEAHTQPEFKDIYKAFDELKEIEKIERPHPVTGKMTKLSVLIKEADNIAYPGRKDAWSKSGLALDHADPKGVKGQPFNSIRVATRAMNEAAGQFTRGMSDLDPTFGKKAMGYSFKGNILPSLNKYIDNTITKGVARTPKMEAAKLKAAKLSGQTLTSEIDTELFQKTEGKGWDKFKGKYTRVPILERTKEGLRIGSRLPTVNEPLFGVAEADKMYTSLKDLLFKTQKGTPAYNKLCGVGSKIMGRFPQAAGGRTGYRTAGAVDACPIIPALENAPEETIKELSKLKDEKGVVGKVKNTATSLLNFAKKGGKFGAIAAAGAATAGLVKTFMNDDPTTYLSNEDQQKNMLIEMLTGSMDDTPQERPEILDWQLPVLGAETVAGTAVTAPSTIEAARSARFGKKPSGLTKTALKTLGRGLATTGTPLGLAALEPLHIAGQIQQGDSPAEIATNPWNYAGLAFADDLSKFATKGLGANVGKIMRLGISPAALKVGSRFFGMPGLALSLGISGYEMYDDYKKKRGWFSEE